MRKHKVISTVAALACALSIFTTTAAPAYALSPIVYAADNGIELHYEQTEWYFRVNNGILEKRLWSRTYGRWLTDWEPL